MFVIVFTCIGCPLFMLLMVDPLTNNFNLCLYRLELLFCIYPTEPAAAQQPILVCICVYIIYSLNIMSCMLNLFVYSVFRMGEVLCCFCLGLIKFAPVSVCGANNSGNHSYSGRANSSALHLPCGHNAHIAEPQVACHGYNCNHHQ